VGGAGDPPAPLGDPPSGTGVTSVCSEDIPLRTAVLPVPSGESPDGTGESPATLSEINGFMGRLVFGRGRLLESSTKSIPR